MHKCKSFQSPQGHIKIKLNLSSHGYSNGSLSKCFQTNKIILSKLSNRKDVFTEWRLFPPHWETFLKRQQTLAAIWPWIWIYLSRNWLRTFESFGPREQICLNKKGKAEKRAGGKLKKVNLTLYLCPVQIRIYNTNIFFIFSITWFPHGNIHKFSSDMF